MHDYGLDLKGATGHQGVQCQRTRQKIPREALVIFVLFSLHWSTSRDCIPQPYGAFIVIWHRHGPGKNRARSVRTQHQSRLWSLRYRLAQASVGKWGTGHGGSKLQVLINEAVETVEIQGSPQRWWCVRDEHSGVRDSHPVWARPRIATALLHVQPSAAVVCSSSGFLASKYEGKGIIYLGCTLASPPCLDAARQTNTPLSSHINTTPAPTTPKAEAKN